jgi:hypothetical protein
MSSGCLWLKSFHIEVSVLRFAAIVGLVVGKPF